VDPSMTDPPSTANQALGTGGRLLTPREVAELFRVDPRTPTRWAVAGRISCIRTPGGHRRFRESDVRALLAAETAEGAST
jgi:excisionase family DNA binding protein